MTEHRPYSRHGLNAVKARVKLRGLAAIDMRTVAAREMIAFRDDLVSALGGESELSPQRRKLVDLAARATLYLDHIDGWLAATTEILSLHVDLGGPKVVPFPNEVRSKIEAMNEAHARLPTPERAGRHIEID